MAIDNFVPEIWHAALLSALRDKLVYGSLCNTDYEGDNQAAGDTVRVNTIGDPTVAAYTPWSTSITYEQLADTEQTMVVNESDYFAFAVEDIEKVQALPGAVEEATRNASVGMAQAIEDHVSDTMYAAVNATGNDFGAYTADRSDSSAGTETSSTVGSPYNLLTQLRTILERDNVPSDGRWAVVPPEVYGLLLLDPRFIDASKSNDPGALRNGFVGRAAGFDIFESNRTPDPTASTYAVIAGHRMATTFASQLKEVEAIRLESSFKDGVRGLQLYDAKVFRPTCLALASVTIQA